MNGSLRKIFRAGGTLAFLFLLPMLFSGCTTKTKAREQSKAAFIAGQRQAMIQMQQQQQAGNSTNQTQQEAGPSVTVVGQVKKPVLPWTQELTVARAILASEYYAQAVPASIVLRRLGQEIKIDPKRLMNGEDYALQPGDVLEIRQ